MLLKFHCKINPIELVWGRSKAWVRKHCKYTMHCLPDVPKSYAVTEDRLGLVEVQQFRRKVANYHEVYARNKTGPAAVAEREKYKPHRRPAPLEFINPA